MRWMLLLVLGLAENGWRTAAIWAQNDEEAAVVVGEDEGVISDGADASNAATWNARAIALRPVGGQPAYIRQSSEAFDDPDARQSLELKYYFELPESALAEFATAEPAGLSRGAKLTAAAELATVETNSGQPWSGGLPLAIGKETPGAQDVEWLDYYAAPKNKLIAALLGTPGDANAAATLIVARVASAGDRVTIEKPTATRELSVTELPGDTLPGGLLDTWDRPRSLGPKAMFFGRAIGVLKQIDGRYAVDFYGEALNPESDCRVWLWPEKNGQGKPVGIRFVEIPVKKGDDKVGQVWAMGVAVRDDQNQLRAIAFDYPLCRPAVMTQLQRAAPAGGAASPPPDLEKMVGADILDEYARRLVNGAYR